MFYFFAYFRPGFAACRISVPRPGIEPWPWQWKHWILTIRPPGNSQFCFALKKKKIYLGLCCHAWAFSSCGFSSSSGGFLLWSAGARCLWAQELGCMGLLAPQHMGSSRIRDWTHVPCIGRQILIHCTTKEVLFYFKWVHFYSDVTFSWLYWQIVFCAGGNVLGILAKI